MPDFSTRPDTRPRPHPGGSEAPSSERAGLRDQLRGLNFQQGADLLKPPGHGPAPDAGATGGGPVPDPGTPAADGTAVTAPPPTAVGDLPMLRQGSTGPKVGLLQQLLNAVGAALDVDGVFGPLTRGEVTKFQSGHGLAPDGVVGPLTWGGLQGGGTTSGFVPGDTPAGLEGLQAVAAQIGAAVEMTPVDLAKLLGWAALNPLSALTRLSLVAWEIEQDGPYGPAYMALAEAGLLPAPATYFEREARRIRWFIRFGRLQKAYLELNGLRMLDLLDVLRQLPPADQKLLRERVETDAPGTDVRRLRIAMDTVLNGTAPAEAASLPQDQQEEIQGFTDLRNWSQPPPVGLPRANRPRGKRIVPKGNPRGQGREDVLVRDIGLSLDQLAPKQQATVELIRRHRERLPSRLGDEHLRAGNGKGYMYTGPAEPTPTALSGDQDTPLRRAQKLVWAELSGEGTGSAINTWDDQILTWGRGFAAKGGLPSLMANLYAKDPAFQNAFRDAGFDVEGTGNAARWMVVDTVTGAVEEGNDALRLMQFDPKLLSVLIDMGQSQEMAESGTGQGRSHTQNFSDAQFEELSRPGRPADVVGREGWAPQVLVFCAHSIHWGANTWGQFSGDGDQAVRTVATSHSTPRGTGRVMGSGKTPSFFALGKSQGALGNQRVPQARVPEVPSDGSEAGRIYFEVPGGFRVLG